MSKKQLQFDEIGYWSEVKLDIVRKYATAYSKILSAHPAFHHIYIDGFAGAGRHISRSTGQFVPGSPLNALLVKPPFRDYYLVDILESRVQALQEMAGNRPDVHILAGDCNEILLRDVFPLVRYEEFMRGLCVLDPYGLDVNWEVLRAAGQSKTIEIFLNFPVMAMNRNVLWRNPANVSPEQAKTMSRYWGDETWHEKAYRCEQGLFGEMQEKEGNEVIASAFRDRLRHVAGFGHVPEPIPMRNTKGAIIYYLYFAAHKPVAADIVRDIFNKYRNWGDA
ncbi:MAG: three-Cys-motif partner protein TcmP [Planctomycetes bacterium]|nr:three-Cys-motif partner protein TcmP [Planctomycetota bacterium]